MIKFLSAALASVFATAIALSPSTAQPDQTKPGKRLLLVTHSAGFVHNSVVEAEKILRETAPKNGMSFTCWRFTGDPDAKVSVKVKGKDGAEDSKVESTALEEYSKQFRGSTGEIVTREQCGRINATTLKDFDLVLFFTTGNPLTKDELKDLMDWVKAGHGFAGTHCATDTLYNTPYGELVGAFFQSHPWTQKIKVKVEDSKHPAAKGFETGAEIDDEIYMFRDAPYSREKLHIIMSVDNSSIDLKKGARKDNDYAVAWCQEFGKGRSFYTSLGHRKEVWRDPRFQESIWGGLKWAAGVVPGDATPSGMASDRK